MSVEVTLRVQVGSGRQKTAGPPDSLLRGRWHSAGKLIDLLCVAQKVLLCKSDFKVFRFLFFSVDCTRFHYWTLSTKTNYLLIHSFISWCENRWVPGVCLEAFHSLITSVPTRESIVDLLGGHVNTMKQ